MPYENMVSLGLIFVLLVTFYKAYRIFRNWCLWKAQQKLPAGVKAFHLGLREKKQYGSNR